MLTALMRACATALASCLLLALCRPVIAEEDPVIIELGDLKVRRSVVWKVEQARLEFEKTRNPRFDPGNIDRQRVRHEIAYREYEAQLMCKIAQDNKLAATPEQMKAELDMFRKWLEERKMTEEKFCELNGKTKEEFAKDLEARVAIRHFVEDKITDQELQEVFDKERANLPLRRCSHILYMYKGATRSEATRTKEEARKLAEDTLAKLKDGKQDFAALARSTSDCPSKKDGGDLNFSPQRGEGAMVAEFAEALYKIPAEVGSLSPVVETAFGFHVIKLTDVKTFADLKEMLKQHRFQEKSEKLKQQAEGGKEPTFNRDLLKDNPPGEPKAGPAKDGPPVLKLPQ